MKKLLIAAALLAASSPYTLARAAGGMDCAHYSAMDDSGRMAAIDSMRGSMAGANKMGSSDTMSSGIMSSEDHMSTQDIAGKVAAACKSHPDMMVDHAMKGAMAH